MEDFRPKNRTRQQHCLPSAHEPMTQVATSFSGNVQANWGTTSGAIPTSHSARTKINNKPRTKV
ncbi:hypothetical protein E4U30_008174 [Claviceps sp. LM220 group G6]|nr:hypothetical protein E4U15_000604 [Claviceps sp. LM218 group G6]KAG6098322.1 hypothetical protein E4U30_008174 [Claviceps sp. LM220 group G6]